MIDEKPIVEDELDGNIPDPDEVPLRDRKVVTQPYDLAVESLVQQIKNNTVFLRPMSNRPNFQRNYPESVRFGRLRSIQGYLFQQ